MDADDKPSVSVRIPHGVDLDDLDSDVFYMSVPGPLVDCAINTLQAVLVDPHDEEDPGRTCAGYRD